MEIFDFMKRNKRWALAVLSILLAAVITMFLFYQQERVNQIKLHVNGLLENERISYFALESSKGEKINISNLSKSRVSAVFIFREPCTLCDSNIKFWNKLAQKAKGRASFFGVVLSKDQSLVESANILEFPLRYPQDRLRFKKAMRMNLNVSYTILLHGNKVIYSKAGDLSPDDYFDLLKKI